jgi:hypothetical protein
MESESRANCAATLTRELQQRAGEVHGARSDGLQRRRPLGAVRVGVRLQHQRLACGSGGSGRCWRERGSTEERAISAISIDRVHPWHHHWRPHTRHSVEGAEAPAAAAAALSCSICRASRCRIRLPPTLYRLQDPLTHPTPSRTRGRGDDEDVAAAVAVLRRQRDGAGTEGDLSAVERDAEAVALWQGDPQLRLVVRARRDVQGNVASVDLAICSLRPPSAAACPDGETHPALGLGFARGAVVRQRAVLAQREPAALPVAHAVALLRQVACGKWR